MKNITLYYPVYSSGKIGDRHESMDSAQSYIAGTGSPHHVVAVMSVTYGLSAGQINSVESQTVHPVWYQHWRNLELAKRNHIYQAGKLVDPAKHKESS